jgi:hypothetical protein
MARKPMVTRTVTTTKAKILCVNTVAEETVTQAVEVPRTYTDDSKLLKAVKETLDETIIPVKVISTETVETLYGMTEQQFIELAEKLPPRTKVETDKNAQD